MTLNVKVKHEYLIVLCNIIVVSHLEKVGSIYRPIHRDLANVTNTAENMVASFVKNASFHVILNFEVIW